MIIALFLADTFNLSISYKPNRFSNICKLLSFKRPFILVIKPSGTSIKDMKHMRKKLTALLINLLLILSLPIYATPVTYTLDPDHTYVLWHINHFGFSNPSGKWMATGTLMLDKDKPQNSKVSATIAVTNMITGIPELDKHLKGELFFNTDKYPTATFTSNKVILIGKKVAKVQGILTLRGVSKPITLNVKLNNISVSPITNKETAGFSASTTLNRSDYGMNALLPGLSDQVKLEIEAEAYKAS